MLVISSDVCLPLHEVISGCFPCYQTVVQTLAGSFKSEDTNGFEFKAVENCSPLPSLPAPKNSHSHNLSALV